MILQYISSNACMHVLQRTICSFTAGQISRQDEWIHSVRLRRLDLLNHTLYASPYVYSVRCRSSEECELRGKLRVRAGLLAVHSRSQALRARMLPPLRPTASQAPGASSPNILPCRIHNRPNCPYRIVTHTTSKACCLNTGSRDGSLQRVNMAPKRGMSVELTDGHEAFMKRLAAYHEQRG